MELQVSEALDIRERGRANGEVIYSDRRLFMQFLGYGEVTDSAALVAALDEAGLDAVLYEDLNDPQGVGLLVFNEDPNFFMDSLRPFLNRPPFVALLPKPEYTLFGRTYALGYEPDLDETLVDRPWRKVIDPAHRWAIWYPLRRAGSFEQLSSEDQTAILREHGTIGMAYGRAGLGTDIRLTCHGLDKMDNDFVVGLLGAELYPLSSIVQAMRKTKQTSLHLERLGPFFVGRVVWQSKRNPV
jgi:hypothetical protein